MPDPKKPFSIPGPNQLAVIRAAVKDGRFEEVTQPSDRKAALKANSLGFLDRDRKSASIWYPTDKARALLTWLESETPAGEGNQPAPYQLLPPLSPEDYAALEADIIARGVLVPVEYDEAGNILDGHHRVQICESLGLVDWPRFVRKGLSEEEKRAHARALNLNRRHLSSAQKREIIEEQLKETPSISSRAIAARMGVDHKTVSAVRSSLVSNGEIPQLEKTEGRDGRMRPAKPMRTMFLPDRANVKELKVVAKQIRDREREVSRSVRTGLINAIAEQGKVVAGQMPRAAFAVGYADPPWQQEAWSDETGQDRGLMYPAMPLDEIMALCAGDRSPFTADAILYLWVTTNRLDDGLAVLKTWGFDYVSAITWDKVNIGMGRWVRDRTEHLLIGKRGNFPGLIPGTQPESIYAEPKTAHSRKPVWFAEQIERLFPDMRKLELFQRRESLSEGDIRRNGNWSFWGFEASEGEAA
ncbi:MT-A70 family methyltransferase [Rhizobium oryzicola]|uniref:MT-A70 family methyltransferase n=1 Tax=Rhizobium oryzicola TaxID=1232668 RepID=A0ABT8SX10_9HYPH|nr:MT-A70 family methyltransferase [Rhizobium oryzicola]MDO1582413.1 MT-A70 family methyltransferase [Rhizobium oryzicola]